MEERIIFHIDVNNAFLSWTAVKLLQEGSKVDIRKIPSVIGGNEQERKGIVLAKSPVAKKYKIVTAEPLYQARKKCPWVKVFPPSYEWYQKQSNNLFNYLSQYSPTMEKASIDECFLDMTGTNYLYKDYVQLAHHIKDEVKNKFGFTVNIGIANNKLCAKMASDFEKPDKVHTLFQNEIEEKMWPLAVDDLLMVGKSTAAELHKLNISTIKDLAQADYSMLKKHFKSQAEYFKNASRGIDNTPVVPKTSKNESISTTETLLHDTTNHEKLKEILLKQTEEVALELRGKGLYVKTVAVIFKNSSFESYSAQTSVQNPTNNTKEIYKLVVKTFEANYKDDPIRLIGVRLANLTSNNDRQLSLFEEETKEDEIQTTIDTINKKFGKAIISSASLKKIEKNN